MDVLPRVVPGEVPGGPRHILHASALRRCPRHKDGEVVRTNCTKSHTSSHPLSWPTKQVGAGTLGEQLLVKIDWFVPKQSTSHPFIPIDTVIYDVVMTLPPAFESTPVSKWL